MTVSTEYSDIPQCLSNLLNTACFFFSNKRKTKKKYTNQTVAHDSDSETAHADLEHFLEEVFERHADVVQRHRELALLHAVLLAHVDVAGRSRRPM